MITTKVGDIVLQKGIDNKTNLARDLHMSRYAVFKLINNETPLRLDLSTIEKLCRVLNVMPNDLFEITNDDGTVWKPR